MKKIFTILFYPFVLIFSIFIAIYVIIKSYFLSSKVSTEYEPVIKEDYSIYFENNEFKLFSIYAGEIRMGPIYLGLKSEPRILEIESGIYGDWIYKTESGIYLQKWNSMKNPNTDLIFIDFKNLDVLTIKSNIVSVNWKIENIHGKLIFNDFSGTEITLN